MKKFIHIVLFFIFTSTAFSQDPVNSRTSSYYTFIYKISNDEVKTLYKNEDSAVPEQYFHTLTDFYPTDSAYRKKLPAGHYLFIKSVAGKLDCELESVNNLEMHILNNNRDLLLVFQDTSGAEIKSLNPKVKKRTIRFDEKLNAYRISKTNKQGFVYAGHEGHLNIFSIKRRYNNTLPARTKRRVLGTFPINILVSPVTYTVQSVKSLIKYQRIDPPRIYYRARNVFEPKNHSGYVVLNKPEFKPGDTVKLKAFIVTKKGKPVQKKLSVHLSGYSPRFNKNMGEISPYRKGAYVFEFVLNDSLKLSLDKNYTIYLEDKGENDYPSASFNYEHYELKQNVFSLNPSPANAPHKPASILLKGTDSNDMPLYDIRVALTVKTKSVNDFYEKTLFVRDTLWTHELKLEPLGDTKVALPDSIYPHAAFEYEVIAAFTNADQERQVKTITLSYHAKQQAEIKLKNDSVLFTSPESGMYRIVGLSYRGDTLYTNTVALPYAETLKPHLSSYALIHKKQTAVFLSVRNEQHQIEALAQRTKDSLSVLVQNPRKLLFRYQLFKNNKIVEQGYSNTYTVKRKTHSNDRYYLALQYVWAGEAKNQNYDLAFAKKPLTISIDHPATVFPGQSTEMTIFVKDAFGSPVQNADLTAYAITKKFTKTTTASVPNFEHFKNRKAFNEFSNIKVDDRKITQRLKYDYWKTKLGLDSIDFYHFLYPEKGLFIHYTTAEDSITQIAPYVVQNGEVQPVHYIYFDKELKYYYGVESVEPYSFRANTVKNITLRLRNRLITIPNIPVERGRKLILSLDLNNLPDSVESLEQPVKFTPQEVQNLRPHFLWVTRNQTQNRAYFEQPDFQNESTYRLLRTTQNSYRNQPELVGPFFPGTLKYQSDFEVFFPFKSMMVYDFQPGLVDRTYRNHPFDHYLPLWNVNPSLKDQVQTKNNIEAYWKSLDEKTTYSFRRYPDSNPVSKTIGRLSLRQKPIAGKTRLATFIINLDNPDEYYIYPARFKVFSPLLPGLYQCVVIHADESYVKTEPVRVKAYGETFYTITNEPVADADDFSKKIIERIKQWSEEDIYADKNRMQEMQNIRQLYYSEATDYTSFSGGGQWVSGVVSDPEDGSPIPGVSVIVKGTAIGTATDMNGFYRLYVPHNATLVVSFIGYKTHEIETRNRAQADVQLQMDVQHLSEVVVVGYGVQYRKAMSYSVSTVTETLQGRAAGVHISGTPGAALSIRGVNSLTGTNNPLVIIDGVIMRLEDIDQSKITAIEVLKDAEATAIYGSRAANGVILISTKPGTTSAQLLQNKLPETPQFIAIDENTPGSSLRKNFRDYAFWQPQLRTDKNGAAKFNAAYPDDITGWNIHVLGMASKKRTGQVQNQVQSFKPLVAQLAMPNFLIMGDSTWAIGKITNYSADSLALSKIFSINDQAQLHESVIIKNSFIDSVSLTGAGDSLRVKYEIEHKGYRDGELRKIPVFPLGTKETNGVFASLTNDTVFTLHLNKQSKLKLYAQTDLLDVLSDEIQGLKIYPYDCNEQLASKLKALLAEKTIRNYKKEKFEHDRLVDKILKKLISNQSKDGSWSWWGSNGGSVWITLHVAEALAWAEKLDYKVTYDRTGLTGFLKSFYNYNGSVTDQLKAWIFLSASGERVIAKPLIDTLAKNNKLYNNHYKLLAMRLLQQNGEEPDWKWIEEQKKKTLKGNIYWGEEKTSMWDNDIDNTLLVYRMIEHKNPNHSDLLYIRNYFLERRKQSWRNTYESARIIETLLPALQKTTGQSSPSLTLTGDISHTVTSFPFEKEFVGVQQISITKKGNAPVYFTAYEEKWNPEPEKVEGDFVVKTQWENDVNKLKAGKPVSLQITLNVKKDAEYVMISVPIPAGCSYNSKNQSRTNGEVHREYDLHETRIYCERLRAGTYHYTIQLQPRYKGVYSVNPAKAEWMYFPVIYGRESIGKIKVE